MSKKQKFNLIKQEDGAVLVIVAIGMLFLMSFAALVIDRGHQLGKKQDLQSATDAAALAAGQAILIDNADEDTGYRAALNAAELNGYSLESPDDLTINVDNGVVTVSLSKNVDNYFSQEILKKNKTRITTSAQAAIDTKVVQHKVQKEDGSGSQHRYQIKYAINVIEDFETSCDQRVESGSVIVGGNFKNTNNLVISNGNLLVGKNISLNRAKVNGDIRGNGDFITYNLNLSGNLSYKGTGNMQGVNIGGDLIYGNSVKVGNEIFNPNDNQQKTQLIVGGTIAQGETQTVTMPEYDFEQVIDDAIIVTNELVEKYRREKLAPTQNDQRVQMHGNDITFSGSDTEVQKFLDQCHALDSTSQNRPLYFPGNFTCTNGATIYGAILVQGRIQISGDLKVDGGTTNTFCFVSFYNPDGATGENGNGNPWQQPAIQINNGTNLTGIIAAPYGKIEVSVGQTFNGSIICKYLTFHNAGIVRFDASATDLLDPIGPNGEHILVKDPDSFEYVNETASVVHLIK